MSRSGKKKRWDINHCNDLHLKELRDFVNTTSTASDRFQT